MNYKELKEIYNRKDHEIVVDYNENCYYKCMETNIAMLEQRFMVAAATINTLLDILIEKDNAQSTN